VKPSRHEARWPAALTILAMVALDTWLPNRVRVVPIWSWSVAAAVVLAPMAAVSAAPASAVWLRIERTVTLLFIAAVTAAIVVNLEVLTDAIVRHPGSVSGLSLLSSSVAIWTSNVLVFSLLYWELDRGGPNARASDRGIRPDWFFAQMGTPAHVPADWRPSFADYLSLGFTTATAFSPTDTMPLTSRAKLLMLVQGAISLVAIVVVGARAINVLGS